MVNLENIFSYFEALTCTPG